MGGRGGGGGGREKGVAEIAKVYIEQGRRDESGGGVVEMDVAGLVQVSKLVGAKGRDRNRHGDVCVCVCVCQCMKNKPGWLGMAGEGEGWMDGKMEGSRGEGITGVRALAKWAGGRISGDEEGERKIKNRSGWRTKEERKEGY